MSYDLDYEIYKYIDDSVNSYVPFKDFLKNNNTTFNEALCCAEKFRENFKNLLIKYSIGSQNLVVTCHELIEKIHNNPENPDLHYLYFAVMTDFGLLNDMNFCDYSDKQKIQNYFKQTKLINELLIFLKSQTESNKKLSAIKEYLKKPRLVKNIDCTDETDFLYKLTLQHTFLYENTKNTIYKENLNALLIHINSDEILKSVKPYIIYAVLSRKHGMMSKRKHFIPNLKAIFQYQDYNIYSDNGKNFNNYQSVIELYDHLQRSYHDDSDIDIDLCNFCFANLSPLSEWYYTYCEPNENIPINIRRKIDTVMPKDFPVLLNYYDYSKLNESELNLYCDAEYKLKNQMLDIAEYMI